MDKKQKYHETSFDIKQQLLCNKYLLLERIFFYKIIMEQTKLPLLFTKQFVGICGYPSIYFCTNERCHTTALICENSECSCAQQHKDCTKIRNDEIITMIEHQKQEPSEADTCSFKQIEKIYDDLIDSISEQRIKFLQYLEIFGLTKSSIEFVKIINQQKTQDLRGCLLNQILSQISNRSNNRQEGYYNEKNIKYSQIKCKDLLKNIMETLQKYNSYPLKKLQSKILDAEGQKTIKQFLAELDFNSFQLIFRASEHQFSAHNFHKFCDDVTDTLTLIQTQTGKVFGGYTPLAWKSTEGFQYQYDLSQRSFIFSVSHKQKFNLKKGKDSRAINNNQSYGPGFGGDTGSSDFVIANNCNVTNNSWSYFSSSYGNEKVKNNNQEAHQLLTGQKLHQGLKIKQYEVYRLY